MQSDELKNHNSSLCTLHSSLKEKQMAEKSIIQEKSFNFAVRIAKLYRFLCNEKKEYILSKQLLRSGTSIGANVSEALRGVSKRDFGNKMAIALKEANETDYWLKLMNATEYLSETQYININSDCDEIIRILTSIVKTSMKRDDKNGIC